MSVTHRPRGRGYPRALVRPAGWLFLSAAVVALVGQASPADDKTTPDGVAFFERKIRPVLAKDCYSCHSGSVQAKGGLRLDTRVGLLIGGTSGPAIVPGKPEKSKLIAALHYDGPDMPPADQLPADVIADFEKWIAMGAPDPRGEENKYVPKKVIDYAAARKEWPYTPPKAVAPPADADDWAWSDVDRFVRAKQRETGTEPVADADAATWLRRVSFDLVGLPPTAELIAVIEKDSSRAAREKIVDELLASPRFGERWGRHWLDVARYAESSGKERNFPYPQAWKYRDWVIDAVNADKPFDQFIREQVAGDLLKADSLPQRDANTIATGFLALGPQGLNERNKESYLLDIADEQIENVTRAVLSLSVGCARCHDHKFDPVSMADYYSLAGIFRSTEAKAGVVTRNFNAGQPGLLVTLPSAGKPVEELADQKLLAEIRELEKEANDRRDELRRSRELATAEVLADLSANTPAFLTNLAAVNDDVDVEVPEPVKPDPPPALGSIEDIRYRQLVSFRLNRKLGKLRAKYARDTTHLTAAAVADRPDPQDINIRLRGEADNFGPLAPRGYPQVIPVPNAPAVVPTESGRRQLGEWLTSPDNPLTARVIANRLWAKLYGVGIVPTLDDFGDQGQKPTNPELLDYLAVRLVDQHGWSLKSALKELVLTRTYQLSGADDATNLAKDEANVSLWRWNRKRLDAEELRDAALAASGLLDANRPHGSPTIDLGFRELGPTSDYSPIQKPSRHRSVYLPVLRGKLPEALAAFDMPDPSLVVGQRDTTTSPGQALYLLNSPFVLEQAEGIAKTVLADRQSDDAARVDRVYRTVLARTPSAAERDRALKFLASQPGGGATENQAAWTRLAQALLALPEFRYLF